MTSLPNHQTGNYPVGPDCLRCSKSEARCARNGVCCDACTHTFSGLDGRPYICAGCRQTYVAPNNGPLPEHCPLCAWRKYRKKSGRTDRRYAGGDAA